ncbi:hypothetical protein [Microbacterium deminutum]|uniref:Lipoprotein n=1 Tax=Microbacterium deminutum TaxID=344164 RepID=A0ABN2QEW5_9MICO
MNPRLAAAAVALLLTAGAATGCSSPASTPEPTPSFSSEDEAFAAAEATYRAYVDALNHVDLSDPSTFEGVYAWTTGDANAGARESLSQMHADGWDVSGPTIVALARARQQSPTSPDLNVVALDVCLDISGVRLVDAHRDSVASADRRDLQSMLVTMTASTSSSTRFLISNVDGREGSPECVG